MQVHVHVHVYYMYCTVQVRERYMCKRVNTFAEHVKRLNMRLHKIRQLFLQTINVNAPTYSRITERLDA